MTKLEEVARAICMDLGEDPDATDGGLIMLGRDGIRPNWEGYESTARAAIEATGIEKLIKAARLAHHEMCHTVSPRCSFTDALDALDAALNEQEGLAMGPPSA